MSADINFGENRNWNARSGLFVEMMDRARRHCDDPYLTERLTVAEASGVLGVGGIEDQRAREKLVGWLREAATEWLDELGANSTEPGLADALRRLLEITGDLSQK